MRILLRIATLAICIVANLNLVYSQKVAFLSSDTVRDKFPEAKSAEQRIQSIVETWKRELDGMQATIDDLEFDIKKNRLIWTDKERADKEKELKDIQAKRTQFATSKYEPGGEYDVTVKNIMFGIEQKIYAAVQKVAADEGFDIVWDQSVMPLAYVNFKYDMTVKVLRELGVDTDKLEKELKEKIDKDPRNKEKESRTPTKRKRVSRGGERETDEPEIEFEEKIDPSNAGTPDSSLPKLEKPPTPEKTPDRTPNPRRQR